MAAPFLHGEGNPASTLATAGPLFAATHAIVLRLAAIFPRQRFDHGWLPLAPTRDECKRLVARTPFIGLTWLGVTPSPSSGRIRTGRATWRLR
jgi:hypothetical protein